MIRNSSNRLQKSKRFLESLDEKPISSQLLYTSIGVASSEYPAIAGQAIKAQQEIIEKVASEGPCVIVGRCADQVLSEHYKLLRVFISADEELRINRIMQRDSLNREEAYKKIMKVDRERAAYYTQRSRAKWGAADNYDLCMNTGHFDIDKAAEVIVRIASAGE